LELQNQGGFSQVPVFLLRYVFTVILECQALNYFKD